MRAFEAFSLDYQLSIIQPAVQGRDGKAPAPELEGKEVVVIGSVSFDPCAAQPLLFASNPFTRP